MADESKKVSRLNRSFKAANGEMTPRVNGDVVAIHFETPANGKSFEVTLDSFPPAIKVAALAYGLNATIGNAMGNLDDAELGDPDKVRDAIEKRIKSLQAGEWTGERTGGGRPSQVWEAFVAMRTERKSDVSEKRLADLHAQYFEDETGHKSLLANADFATYLAGYKARKKAGKGPVASSADLLA